MDLKNFPMDVQTCTMQLESCECPIALPWKKKKKKNENKSYNNFGGLIVFTLLYLCGQNQYSSPATESSGGNVR